MEKQILCDVYHGYCWFWLKYRGQVDFVIKYLYLWVFISKCQIKLELATENEPNINDFIFKCFIKNPKWKIKFQGP